uniref:Peptidase S1 domain-containing protein n=1 Tax=Castor canadensis TaxID=51338 RepID=A0A8C0WWC7_CASCN
LFKRGDTVLTLLTGVEDLPEPHRDKDRTFHLPCPEAAVADFGCGLSGGNGVQDEQVLATVPLCHLREEHRCAQEASPPPRALTTLSSPARSRDPRKWTVQLGELTSKPTRWNLQAYHNRYRVEDIISNPLARGVLSDIALLKLASSVTYSRNIQPVCVLSSTFMFQHRPDCWVTGWGALSENKKPLPPPYLLREVQVAILNTTRCRDLFRIPSPLSVINNDTICAGSEDGSVDTCSVSDRLYYQAGLMSWGDGCFFFPWIQLLMLHSALRSDSSLPFLFFTLSLWAPV